MTDVTTATLEDFAAAWNAHDIHALMSFMTDDCVFKSSNGQDVVGTCFRGRDEVRRGFMRVWQLYPNASWNDARHFVGAGAAHRNGFSGGRTQPRRKLRSPAATYSCFVAGRLRSRIRFANIEDN